MATLHNFFDHPRAPAPPVVSVVIPLQGPTRTPLTCAQRQALDFIRSLFWDARDGDMNALCALDIIAHSHSVPQIRRLADAPVQNLRNPPKPPELVTAPCDCEPEGVA